MAKLEVYRTVLRHVVRPEKTTERLKSPQVTLRDFEALWLVTGLREYAAYSSESELEERIAVGYIEYIRMLVHEERRQSVTLYAHTSEARSVLESAGRLVEYANMDSIAEQSVI